MLFDYETLKIIWWLLVGALLIGFAIMDGHDMGVCSLLPFVCCRVWASTLDDLWHVTNVFFNLQY